MSRECESVTRAVIAVRAVRLDRATAEYGLAGQDSLVTEKVFGAGWLGLRGPEKV